MTAAHAMSDLSRSDVAVLDPVLLRRMAEGDQLAFEQFHRFHVKAVQRLAYGIVFDAAEAADIVQAVFLAAFQSAKSWRPDHPAQAWLNRLTVNEALTVRRKLARFVRPATPTEPLATPHESAERSAAIRLVRQAASTLSEVDRALLALHFDQDLSAPEIGEALGLTPNAVRVRLHRALERLKAAVAKEQGGSLNG